MQLQQTVNNVEVGGVQTVTNFTLELNAKTAFLLADPYSDKVGAIVRELTCNAIDAHEMFGKRDVPVTIKMPSRFEPWFSVTDEGPGISHQDMLTVYTGYGVSTKDKSNVAVGGFGIGRFSALSYGESFSIISKHRPTNTKTFYTITKNEIGVPVLLTNQQVELQPHEKGGFEVRVPIKENDVHTFSTRINQFARWCRVRPNVTGGKLDAPEVVKSLESPTGRWFTRKGENGVVAKMGPVIYKLDLGNCGVSDYNTKHWFDQLGLVFEFKMGEVMPTISREELSYTPATKQAVMDAIQVFRDEAAATFMKEINKEPDLYKARCKFDDLTSGGAGHALKELIGKKWNYKGIELSDAWKYVDIDSHDSFVEVEGRSIIHHKNIQAEIGNIFHSMGRAGKNRFFLDDLHTVDKRMSYKKVLKYNFADATDREEHFWLIRPKNDAHLAKIVAGLGNPPVGKLSELNLPQTIEIDDDGVKKVRKKVLVRSAMPNEPHTFNETYHSLEDGGVYVPLNAGEVKLAGYSEIAIPAHRLDILPGVVFGIPASVSTPDRMLKRDNWQLVTEFVKERFKAVTDKHELTTWFSSFLVWQATPKDDVYTAIANCPRDNIDSLDAKHPVRAFREQVEALHTAAFQDIIVIDEVLFDKSITSRASQRPVKFHFADKLKTIRHKWPLLNHLSQHSQAWRKDWASMRDYLTR